MAKLSKGTWGFDASTIDPTVRPQDDFYNYVNGGWIKKTPIPESESYWGTFKIIRFETEKQIKSLVLTAASKKNPAGSPAQMIGDFYRSGMDLKKRSALGEKPLTPWFALVQKVKSTDDLLKLIATFEKIGIGVPFGSGVDQDFKDSSKYMLHIAQSGLGMPDRDYYLQDEVEMVRVRTAYVQHIIRTFKLLGYSAADAKAASETIMSIETQLAQASMSKEDQRSPENIYHKKTIAQLKKHTPQLQWDLYLQRIGAGKLTEVNIMQPDFFVAVEKMISAVPLKDWKTYLMWHITNDFSSFLSPAFKKEQFSFAQVLTGVKKQRALWRQVLGVVDSSLDELLGQLYVEKYFSPDAKAKANAIIDDLFTAYEARIKGLEWMSTVTKKKALVKLHSMNRKIGYPDKWKKYTGLVIKADDYAGNIIRVTQFEHARSMKKLFKAVDKGEWFMSPQTVNAYYAPMLNDIAFPAGILQWPFFDPHADAAINYGSMGMSIGHEITHGFDDEGSKFDAAGNMKSWWTEEDRKKFDALAKRVEKQFDQFTVADGVHVNGKLTLGENIADLGGLSIALDAYKLYLDREGRKDIDGLTPEQRFFIGYTQGERDVMRPEMEKTLVTTNPHAPTIFRVNGPIVNMPEFYEAFAVKKGDGHYRDPAKRIKIW